MIQVLRSYIWRQAETLSVGQGEELVVIQDRVEIFHPLWVNVAIKDDPLTLLQLTTHVVNNSRIGTKVRF